MNLSKQQSINKDQKDQKDRKDQKHRFEMLKDDFTRQVNRKCGKKSIDECMYGLHLESITNAFLIGSGSFGSIFLLHGKTDKVHEFSDYAIKCQFNIVPAILYKGNKSYEFKDYTKELMYSYVLGSLGIGPPVRDFYYYLLNKKDAQKVEGLTSLFVKMGKNDEVKGMKDSDIIMIQFIVMKAYSDNCDKFLRSNSTTPEMKTFIVKSMCDLVNKKINCGLYCTDVKPSNFVIGTKDDGSYDIKMIDFGQEFCSETQSDLLYGYSDVVSNIAPNIDILRVSLFIQLFVTCCNSVQNVEKNIGWICEGFRGSCLDTFLQTDDWINAVRIYTEVSNIINVEYQRHGGDGGDGGDRSDEFIPAAVSYMNYVNNLNYAQDPNQPTVKAVERLINCLALLKNCLKPQPQSQPQPSIVLPFPFNITNITNTAFSIPTVSTASSISSYPTAPSLTPSLTPSSSSTAPTAPTAPTASIAPTASTTLTEGSGNKCKLINTVLNIGIVGVLGYAVYKAGNYMLKSRNNNHKYKNFILLQNQSKRTQNQSRRKRSKNEVRTK